MSRGRLVSYQILLGSNLVSHKAGAQRRVRLCQARITREPCRVGGHSEATITDAVASTLPAFAP